MAVEPVEALQAESAAVRWLAIEKLRGVKDKSGQPETFSTLVSALADEHPFVRWQAGLALVSHTKGRQKLVEILQNASATSSPEASLMCSAAADALGISRSSVGSTPLIEALRTGDALLRQSAAEALANRKDPKAVPHLTRAMQDPDPWVRRAAAYALGHLNNQESVRMLIAGLRDQAVIVRRSAAYALGALRAEMAMPQLKISLTDKDPLTRRNAAWALGRIGLREAVPNLTQLLNDPVLDGTVATVASQAIEAITKPRWLQILLGIRGYFQH